MLGQSSVEAADKDLIETARWKAEDIVDKQARDALRQREPGWIDRSIMVSELDESLCQLESSTDVHQRWSEARIGAD